MVSGFVPSLAVFDWHTFADDLVLSSIFLDSLIISTGLGPIPGRWVIFLLPRRNVLEICTFFHIVLRMAPFGLTNDRYCCIKILYGVVYFPKYRQSPWYTLLTCLLKSWWFFRIVRLSTCEMPCKLSQNFDVNRGSLSEMTDASIPWSRTISLI